MCSRHPVLLTGDRAMTSCISAGGDGARDLLVGAEEDHMPQAHGDYTGNFQQPDETRPFKAHGHMDVVQFRDGRAVGRGVFEPGWKWSNDVKPIAGTKSCQADHTGHCLSGSMTIRMDDGKQFQIRPGEAFHIPPGHDAWVDGSEDCVLIDVTGFKEYAKPRA
jgi:mannose-6-phosphate isomerase-like protein (cupin superfamily)